MDPARHRDALFLLAVFIIGGLFAPPLHRIQHEHQVYLENGHVGVVGHAHDHSGSHEKILILPVLEACTGCALCAGIVFWTDLGQCRPAPIQFFLSFWTTEYQSITNSSVYRASARAPPVSA